MLSDAAVMPVLFSSTHSEFEDVHHPEAHVSSRGEFVVVGQLDARCPGVFGVGPKCAGLGKRPCQLKAGLVAEGPA